MTNPAFWLPVVKNNVKTPQLKGSIAAGDLTLALKAGHGASFPSILRATCSSTGSNILLNATGLLGTLAVGDFIENETDGSWAVVTSIAGAPNSVATTPLEGGSLNVWTSGNVMRKGAFVATLVHYDTDGLTVLKRERVKVTNRVTDSLTVKRGYDSDTAQAFSADDYVQMLVEESQFENLQNALRNILQKDNDKSALITNLQNDAPQWLGTITGTDTLTGSATPAKTAYAAGQRFMFIAAANNTGSMTLNVNGLGAKTLKRLDGATNMAAGDVKTGQLIMCVYDGTNMQVQTPQGTASTPTRVKLYASNADSTNLQTQTSDTVFSTLNFQIDANSSVAGDVINVEAWGQFDGGVNNRQLILTLYWGATSLLAMDALQPTTAGTKRAFYAKFQINIRTIGGTGTAQVEGEVRVNSGATTTEIFSRKANDSTVTIDTTTNKNIGLFFRYNIDDGTKHSYLKQSLITRER